MAVAAAGWVVVAPCAHGGAVAAWSAVVDAVVALFGVFNYAIAAGGWAGVTALVNPGAIFGAAGVGSSVEITIVTLLGVFGDAISTAASHPGAVRAAGVAFEVVVCSMVALLAWLEDSVAADINGTDGGAVG